MREWRLAVISYRFHAPFASLFLSLKSEYSEDACLVVGVEEVPRLKLREPQWSNVVTPVSCCMLSRPHKVSIDGTPHWCTSFQLLARWNWRLHLHSRWLRNAFPTRSSSSWVTSAKKVFATMSGASSSGTSPLVSRWSVIGEQKVD